MHTKLYFKEFQISNKWAAKGQVIPDEVEPSHAKLGAAKSREGEAHLNQF